MLRSCESHDGCVVVWDDDERNPCPVCVGLEEMKDASDKVEQLEAEITELEDKVTDLEREAKEAVENG